MEQLFRGQAAIVTGAGSLEGIGFAIARALLRAGAEVAITSTTERIHQRARELDPSGRDVLAIVGDLTVEEDSRRIVDVVFERYGRIDVLINNAGMAQTGASLEGKTLQESSYSDWRRQIEITLHTAFLMTRAVLPVMTQKRYGESRNGWNDARGGT
jgi:3-oxoacyl-[acyl-carrier protein] reductase